jgi:putative flippase GtrA
MLAMSRNLALSYKKYLLLKSQVRSEIKDEGGGKRGVTVSHVEREVGELETRYGVVKTLRFAIAGAVGFLVTESVLTIGLLVFFGKLTISHASFTSPELLGLDVLSLVIGVSASFFVNERITVHVPKVAKGEKATKLKRFLKFQAVSGIGNIGIIAVQLALLAALEVSPLLGTVIGAVATYPIVYFISIKYVWKAHRTR